MTQSTSDRDYAAQQEADTALDRARGHVQELRRLWEQGGTLGAALPYFDQLEADLNTLRPQHVGSFSAIDGAPLYGDGTRATGAQAAPYQSSVEPGSMASRPAVAGDAGSGFEYPAERQPYSERDAELEAAGRDEASQSASATERRGEETDEERAERVRAADATE